MHGLNVVINLNKLALLPTPRQTKHFIGQSATLTIGLTIGCSHNRGNRLPDNRVIVQSVRLNYYRYRSLITVMRLYCTSFNKPVKRPPKRSYISPWIVIPLCHISITVCLCLPLS